MLAAPRLFERIASGAGEFPMLGLTGFVRIGSDVSFRQDILREGHMGTIGE
jgi:hypothetical protein